METGFVRIDTVDDCCRFFSAATLHPSACVVDVRGPYCGILLRIGLCTVLFRESSCPSCFGLKSCDFQDGTLSFVSPGRPVNIGVWSGEGYGRCRLLCFSPDLLRQLSAAVPGGYTFFGYRQDESLHLSCRERRTVTACMEDISAELGRGVDGYTARLLANRIELLLTCSSRFYSRQFVTRHDENLEIVGRAGSLAEDYFLAGQARFRGLPGREYLSRMLGMSAAYLEDLLRHETGKTAGEFVRSIQIGIARRQLLHTSRCPECIAEELGFPSVRAFRLLFRRLTGHAPEDCRRLA